METLDIKTKQTLVRKTIWLCWFALIGCFIVKLFGGNYFEIIANNEHIVNLCDFINSNFLKYIVRFIQANLSFYLYTCSIAKRNLKIKESILVEIFILFDVVIKYINPDIGFICDCIVMTLIPFVLSSKSNGIKIGAIRTVFGFALINIFQIISLIVRNLGIKVLDAPTLVEIILEIDYYIMLILYYLYSVKLKGEWFMGQSGWLWFGSDMAMDRGYAKFVKVMALIGILLTFPISVPYLLWKKHKKNKMVKV